MKRASIVALLCAVVLLSGCITVRPAEMNSPLTRERIFRVIDLGELGTYILLNFAEAKGQDIKDAREVTEASFAFIRSLLEVELNEINKTALEEAFKSIKIAGNNALVLCAAAGVSSEVISQASVFLNDSYIVIESLIQWLPEKANG